MIATKYTPRNREKPYRRHYVRPRGGSARLSHEHVARNPAPSSPAEPGRQAGVSGLVYSQTTDTQKSQSQAGQVLDPRVCRQSRMRKSLLTGARLIVQERTKGGFRGRFAMVGCSYRPDAQYEPGDITALVKSIRQYLKRRGVKFYGVWKAELGEKNGRFHYHLLVWLPRGITLPKPDKQGWWKKGSTRIEWAKNAVGYVAKYVSKIEDGDLPKGARMYCVLGLTGDDRNELNWWKCPKWVREVFTTPEMMPVRRRGGGLVSRTTGEYLESRYKFGGFCWIDGRRCIRLVEVGFIDSGPGSDWT